MFETFFGLDLRCGRKIVMWTYFIENLTILFSIIGLMMCEKICDSWSKDFQVPFFEEGFEDHVRCGKEKNFLLVRLKNSTELVLISQPEASDYSLEPFSH